MNDLVTNCETGVTPARPRHPGRRWTRVGLLVGTILLAGAIIVVLRYDPAAPRYVITQQHSLRQISSLSYPFLAERPFAGGRVWLSLADGTNAFESVLFDLEAGTVVGRLENAFPVQSDEAGTFVLCVNRVPRRINLWQRGRMLAGAGLRNLNLPPPRWLVPPAGVFDMDDENFWLVDLRSGRAHFAGTMPQMRGTGSTFRFSPDFRHGLNKPPHHLETNAFVLDIAAKELRTIQLQPDDWPIGWWDNETFLLSRNGLVHLVGLDGRERLLFGTNDVATILARQGLAPFERNPNPIAYWAGDRFEFFLTDTHKRWSAEASVLLKINRPDGRLELVDPRFKFEWSDHFDPTARHYLYTGREAGDRSDAVLVRDLVTGSEQPLVPTTGAKVFSIPNFYGDRILYVRSNQLWSVGMDGSTPRPLFPPPAQP